MKNYIYLGVLVILTAACAGKKQADQATEEITREDRVSLTAPQLANAGILTGRMEQKSLSYILKVNGKIDVPPQNMVSISVPMGGYLKSTRLLAGMHVKKGDVIATVEDQQYIQLQQDYLTAKSRLPFLEKEYIRQKELNQSLASSDKVYQLAESEYRSQQVLITSLREKLQLAGIDTDKISETHMFRGVDILAPINGFVSKVNVNIGKYISPTEVLFELVNPADIHLALKVYEKDVNLLNIGQALVAYTNNQPSEKYPCEILLIGKDLSPDGNTDVHCHFKTYDKSLIPGTYMNAEIKIKTEKSWVLPEEAVVKFDNRDYAFTRVGSNEFKMRELKTGNSENGFIEITGGGKMDAGEWVTKGAYSLLMKLKNKSED